MKRQINQSLSPGDEAINIPQKRRENTTSEDHDGVSADIGDTLFKNFQPFTPSLRHDESPKPEITENECQSKGPELKRWKMKRLT
jgi:hypothetical protein